MRPNLQAWWNVRTAIFASLAAIVFFSRAWLVKTWGSPLPFWDQWDAEVIGLYGPWLRGSLHWADLFRAHNEHRILLTRLADLILFWGYGGWNPWAQLLLNAALHAATAMMLAIIFWPALAPRSRAFFLAGVALLFTSACGWQNALYGFQSQVYFANLLAVAAIAGLCRDVPFGTYWWLGLIASALALFSNAGGILAVVAALIAQVGFARRDRNSKTAWLAAGIISVLLIAAFLFLSSKAPQHAAFRAKTIRDFVAVLTHCLAWPWINVGAFFFITQMPLLWLVAERWRNRAPMNSAERCAIALGLFAMLQAAAIAHSRGAVLPESRPISRYQDPLLLGVFAQLFAMTQIFSGQNRAGRMAGLVWSGVVVAGLIGLTETNFSLHLPFKRAQDTANLAIVRAYASTGDFSVFTRDPNFSGPHPDPRVVQRVLDDPELRALLPADVLAPADHPAPNLPWVIRHSFLLTASSGTIFLGLLAALGLSASNRSHPAVAAQSGPH